MTERITAEEFDKKFESGEDISEYVDWDHAINVPRLVKQPASTVRPFDREMCEIFDEIRQEGVQEGLREGIDIGRSEGIDIGRSEGRSEQVLASARSLMEGLSVGVNRALELLGVSEQERPHYQELLEAGVAE